MAATVRLYQHADYGGASITLDANRRSLPRGFSQAVSSIKTTTPIVLFRENSFRGDAMVIDRDTPRLSSVRARNFNDRARSVLVAPVTIKLHVIVGVVGNVPARSFDDINQDVIDVNDAFAQYGLRVDVDKLTVGGPHTPQTMDTFTSERDPLRSDDHLNVTYFDGPLYTSIAWRWRVRSVRAEPAPGSRRTPSATLFTDPNFAGSSLRVNSEIANVPASHRERVRSLDVDPQSIVTVFSERNFVGQSRTFHNGVANMDDRQDYFDWWRSKTASATGQSNDWRRFDITMQPRGSRNQLTWGVSQALRTNPSGAFDAADAESALRHIVANPNVRRATDLTI